MRPPPLFRPALLALLGVGVLGGCGGTPASAPPPSATHTLAPTTPSPTSAATAPTSPAASPVPTSTATATAPALGTVPPAWLGQRPLPLAADGYGEVRRTPAVLRDRRFTLPDSLPMLPGTGFASRVERAPVGVLARSSWEPTCPIAVADLDWVRLTFWGFDDRRHTGELLVAGSAADDLVRVFHTLYDARFPLEQMRITTRAELDAHPTGDGDDTSAFACRPSVGETTWSQHAYGLAIDVNPFQNPYVNGARVLPELASAYLDRADVRPGMIEPDGVVVRAFASIGWTWGGTWHSLKDLQHFSANGR